jgi:hypothetical protein
MNQLTKLSEIGYLDHAVDASTAPALPQLTATAPVEDRARAYLHANCSGCHRPETGIAGGRIDFRFREPRTTLRLCVPATLRNVQDARIIMPGAPERSAVFLRMSDRADLQMPPLGTRVVDQPATALVEEWIRSLAPTECN